MVRGRSIGPNLEIFVDDRPQLEFVGSEVKQVDLLIELGQEGSGISRLVHLPKQVRLKKPIERDIWFEAARCFKEWSSFGEMPC